MSLTIAEKQLEPSFQSKLRIGGEKVVSALALFFCGGRNRSRQQACCRQKRNQNDEDVKQPRERHGAL